MPTSVDLSAAKPLVESTEQVGPPTGYAAGPRQGRGRQEQGRAAPRSWLAAQSVRRARAPPSPSTRPPLRLPQAVTATKPFVDQAITFLTTTEPTLLGQYALAVLAAYYLTPPLLRAGVGLLRGYAGDISAAAALTAVESEGSAFIVDIRSLRDKEAGAPDIPNASERRAAGGRAGACGRGCRGTRCLPACCSLPGCVCFPRLAPAPFFLPRLAPAPFFLPHLAPAPPPSRPPPPSPLCRQAGGAGVCCH